MEDGPGGREGDGRGWAALLDPAVATRALAEVQAQGVRAASELVDRIVRSVDGARERAEEAVSARAEGGSGAPAPDDDARLLIETWIELAQQAAGSISRIGAERGDERAAAPRQLAVDGTSASEAPLVVTVDRAGRVLDGSGEIWLHNGTPGAVGPLTVRCSELRAPEGSVLAAGLVAEPTALDELPARSSRGLELSVVPTGELRDGPYRGIVQVEGAPSVWLPVEVRVTGSSG